MIPTNLTNFFGGIFLRSVLIVAQAADVWRTVSDFLDENVKRSEVFDLILCLEELSSKIVGWRVSD